MCIRDRVTKREIESHCIGVPKFIMCGSRNSGRQSVVSQENYNFLTNNMNKLLEEEKADKIREQFEETLPFDMQHVGDGNLTRSTPTCATDAKKS